MSYLQYGSKWWLCRCPPPCISFCLFSNTYGPCFLHAGCRFRLGAHLYPSLCGYKPIFTHKSGVLVEKIEGITAYCQSTSHPSNVNTGPPYMFVIGSSGFGVKINQHYSSLWITWVKCEVRSWTVQIVWDLSICEVGAGFFLFFFPFCMPHSWNCEKKSDEWVWLITALKQTKWHPNL